MGGMLVTSFGLGRLRPAPGTWGSIPPVLLAVLLLILGAGPTRMPSGVVWGWGAWLGYHAVLLAVLVVFSIGCLSFGDVAEAAFGKKDPGSVCADETAGMCLPLMFLPSAALAEEWAHWTLLLAFLSFRMFDILKLPPARGLQRHPGGVGILVDDLVAGVQAMVLVQIVTRTIMN
jgi:phosphatidylglycerophosphatase A